MDEQELGRRLKELRGQAGLTQRELARRVGVNYSYISKIEHGAMAPPGEKLIERLASVLGADEEELTALAGRIPSDVIEILRSRGAARMSGGSLVGRGWGFLRGGKLMAMTISGRNHDATAFALDAFSLRRPGMAVING